jgi:6,7-dimethyl-8-ribityllumazine synthase
MQEVETGQWQIFDASRYKVGIVASQFNRNITDPLLDSVMEGLRQYNVSLGNITTIRVSGSIEVPLILQQLARTKQYQCLMAVGAVIRGETTHYDYVCKFVTEGVLRVQLKFDIPVGFGILTCENQEQALARTRLGAGYAEAALQSTRIIESINFEES